MKQTENGAHKQNFVPVTRTPPKPLAAEHSGDKCAPSTGPSGQQGLRTTDTTCLPSHLTCGYMGNSEIGPDSIFKPGCINNAAYI